jgi:hypothetical protein
VKRLDFTKNLSNNEKADLLRTIKLPRNISDINKQLPKGKGYDQEESNSKMGNGGGINGIVESGSKKRIERQNSNKDKNGINNDVVSTNSKDNNSNNKPKPQVGNPSNPYNQYIVNARPSSSKNDPRNQVKINPTPIPDRHIPNDKENIVNLVKKDSNPVKVVSNVANNINRPSSARYNNPQPEKRYKFILITLKKY